ncbi:hypothetical protein FA95DRAFT_1561076 [Auriscalpium vulgare]|uniref:Uncharacterized protein n=1 Tax=Auriscalpium vulgare TaxID=40419 RepID=A0ACB8RN07_9AGAM|nr:hypothetical protein FA95DRAFT_1561076 [Auriscalpium vulgare]
MRVDCGGYSPRARPGRLPDSSPPSNLARCGPGQLPSTQPRIKLHLVSLPAPARPPSNTLSPR